MTTIWSKSNSGNRISWYIKKADSADAVGNGAETMFVLTIFGEIKEG